MRWIETADGRTYATALCWGLLLIAGCASYVPEEPPPAGQPEVVILPPPAPEPESAPVIKPAPVPPPALPPVAILLTNSQPAYAEVAASLAGQLEDYRVYDLSADDQPPVSVLRAINDSAAAAVVAIGLRAAQSAVAMATSPVIFSQVFNYQDAELLQESSRGVEALPPPRAQLAAWQESEPALARVGTIVGPGHEDLIAAADLAAQELGLELRAHVAHSDQETLYLFRRMIRDIDGFWLLPDNRILSRRVLGEMLAEANRLSVPVAVPNDALLEMGGAISMTAVASDIAATIVDLLREIESGRINSVPPMNPLSELRVTTGGGPQVAER